MQKITIYIEEDVNIQVDQIISELNKISQKIKFQKGQTNFRLEEDILEYPKSFDNLDSSIIEETEGDLSSILVSKKPYNDNYFFHVKKRFTLISFYGWDYLTHLSMNNGLVYFISDILSLKIDHSFRHQDTTGCIYDFLRDKRGIDRGIRDAVVCSDCKTRISKPGLFQDRRYLLDDTKKILNDLGSASKWDQDIVEYWKEKSQQGTEKFSPPQEPSLKTSDFLPTKDDNNFVNKDRNVIGDICENYEKIRKGNIDDNEKGKLFEDFTSCFFKLIKGWKELKRNQEFKNFEIDIVYDIADGPDALRNRLGNHIFVECKNRNKKSDSGDIDRFINNLELSGSKIGIPIKTGIFFSYNGISGYTPENLKSEGGAYERMLDLSKAKSVNILPFVSEDIEVVRAGKNLIDHLTEIYNRPLTR